MAFFKRSHQRSPDRYPVSIKTMRSTSLTEPGSDVGTDTEEEGYQEEERELLREKVALQRRLQTLRKELLAPAAEDGALPPISPLTPPRSPPAKKAFSPLSAGPQRKKNKKRASSPQRKKDRDAAKAEAEKNRLQEKRKSIIHMEAMRMRDFNPKRMSQQFENVLSLKKYGMHIRRRSMINMYEYSLSHYKKMMKDSSLNHGLSQDEMNAIAEKDKKTLELAKRNNLKNSSRSQKLDEMFKAAVEHREASRSIKDAVREILPSPRDIYRETIYREREALERDSAELRGTARVLSFGTDAGPGAAEASGKPRRPRGANNVLTL